MTAGYPTSEASAYWTNWATWAQVGVSAATLLVALVAAFSWWSTLKSQRADECVGAIRMFQSAIGKLISSMGYSPLALKEPFDSAWIAQSGVGQSFAIEKRYSNFDKDEQYIRRSIEILQNLEKYSSNVNYYIRDIIKQNELCGILAGEVENDLRPGWIVRTLKLRIPSR